MSAASFPPWLHDDEMMVMEILSWLPVKSLMRFRCVSKTWLRLLTADPYFSKLYFSRSKENNGILFITSSKACLLNTIDIQYDLAAETDQFTVAHDVHINLRFPFPIPRKPVYLKHHGICNGLLCLSYSINKGCYVYIYNPLTRDYISLPFSPAPLGSYFCGPSMIFKFGFGFHQATNEYKVIRFAGSIINANEQVSVYTLGKDLSWRTHQEVIPYNTNFIHGPALVNGAAHWHDVYTTSSSFRKKVILAFDLKEEVFREIPHPIDVRIGDGARIANLDGLLCLFDNHIDKHSFQIWVMKEYGVVNSWRKQFKIGPPLLTDQPQYFELLVLLGATDNGDILLLGEGSYSLYLFNPRTDSIKVVKKYYTFQFVTSFYAYAGTLVSPRFINGSESGMHIIS